MNKILFITSFPPNRLTAGQNYSRELLDSLSEQYDVDLVFFSYEDHEIDINSKINIVKRINVSNISKIYSWLHLPFFHPFFVVRFRLSLLLFLMKEKSKYKFLYFDFSQVFIYSLFIKKTFKIFMCHDIIYQKIKRSTFFYLNPFNLLLFISEKKLLKSANLIFTFSEKDTFLIKDKYKLNSKVVSFFINDKINNINYDKINLEKKFCFFGAWNRNENMEGIVWFFEKVFPSINEEVKFEIIGPSLENSFLDKIQFNDRIKYLGFLDDPYSKIAESEALIAPIFQGAGVKVKVVESLAIGTPIIGTPIAFEGISNLGHNSMLLCTSAKEFINAINTFEALSRNDKSRIKLLFTNSYKTNKVEEILKNI